MRVVFVFMRSRSKSFPAFLTLLIPALAFCFVSAQTKPEDEEIRVETDLIEVPIVVTDKTGKPLLDLKKNNFIVLEDGKPQEISNFAATSAPFEVVLLLDTSGSTLAELPLIRRAAQNFIASLRPGDRVSIVAYRAQREAGKANAISEVIAPLTEDRSLLSRSLEQVQTSFGTPYYDSLIQVTERIFRDPPGERFRGRRAVVALTDGVDSTSVSDFDEVNELLQKTGAAVYFIKVDTQEFFEESLLGDCTTSLRFSQSQMRRYYRKFVASARVEKTTNFCDLGDFERLAISKKLYELADTEMGQLAKTSGGKVFPIGDLSEARAAFKRVADEIGTKYSLGYYSSNEKRDGSYRKIQVQIKGMPVGSQVRAREGYTARSN
jgi:Ca-activated chloride channel family protein